MKVEYIKRLNDTDSPDLRTIVACIHCKMTFLTKPETFLVKFEENDNEFFLCDVCGNEWKED